MASFEEDLEFANKILRVRTAMIDGTIFKDNAFQCVNIGDGNYEITFDHNGGVGIATIAYLENRPFVDDNCSHAGYARILFNSESDLFTVMGSGEQYRYLPTAPDDAWYFQASLVSNDRVLRGATIMKTLAATPMPGFKQFIILPIILDKILKRMDQAGI